MLIDIAIIAVAIGSFFYGRDIGFVRNFSSALGFFFGLFLGAYLQTFVFAQSTSTTTKSIMVAITAFGLGIVFLVIGEYFGIHIKHRIKRKRYKALDKYLGSAFSLLVLLVCVWLLSALSLNLPYTWLQKQVDKSVVITKLNSIAPPAPIAIDDIGYKISGDTAVSQSKLNELGVDDSVYKIVSQGCKELRVGSGFKVSDNLVATNAHVVTGIKNPHIKTSSQILSSDVVYIDTNLDFALLKTSKLPGKALQFDNNILPKGSTMTSLGYSGGGPLKAKPGIIDDRFIAKTNNIFNDKYVKREVYEISSNLQSGDSGGPIIGSNKKVIGMAFAESVVNSRGYGLMSKSISPIVSIAVDKNIDKPVDNNRCSSN